MRSGHHKYGEIDNRVREQSVESAPHPDWAGGEHSLPKVPLLAVTRNFRRDENRRKPNHEDARVQGPNQAAARKLNSRKGHAMRRYTENETQGGENHEWDK